MGHLIKSWNQGISFDHVFFLTGTQSKAVQDEEGHDLLPFFISEDTKLTMTATVFSGGKHCENEGHTISDEIIIKPGKVNLLYRDK